LASSFHPPPSTSLPTEQRALRDDGGELLLGVEAAEGGVGGPAALDAAADELDGVADGRVGVAREDAGPGGDGPAETAEVLAAEPLQQIEQALVAGPVEGLPEAALAVLYTISLGLCCGGPTRKRSCR